MSDVNPIRRVLRHKRITQAELARRTGLSRPYISQVINGVWPLGRRSAVLIYDALEGDIDLYEMLTWEPTPLEDRKPWWEYIHKDS